MSQKDLFSLSADLVAILCGFLDIPDILAILGTKKIHLPAIIWKRHWMKKIAPLHPIPPSQPVHSFESNVLDYAKRYALLHRMFNFYENYHAPPPSQIRTFQYAFKHVNMYPYLFGDYVVVDAGNCSKTEGRTLNEEKGLLLFEEDDRIAYRDGNCHDLELSTLSKEEALKRMALLPQLTCEYTGMIRWDYNLRTHGNEETSRFLHSLDSRQYDRRRSDNRLDLGR